MQQISQREADSANQASIARLVLHRNSQVALSEATVFQAKAHRASM
jgi:hypothetical protein